MSDERPTFSEVGEENIRHYLRHQGRENENLPFTQRFNMGERFEVVRLSMREER